jgi:hypothetical protein
MAAQAENDWLPRVWVLLQARIDTESIQREILGHFYLASADAWRRFTASVMFSGLRALQLRVAWRGCSTAEDQWVGGLLNRDLMPDIRDVRRAIRWDGFETAASSDEKAILQMCVTALEQISQGLTPSGVWHKPACGTCDLRDQKDDLVGRKPDSALNSRRLGSI